MQSKSSFILSSGLLMFVFAAAIVPSLRADEKLKPERDANIWNPRSAAS